MLVLDIMATAAAPVAAIPFIQACAPSRRAAAAIMALAAVAATIYVVWM